MNDYSCEKLEVLLCQQGKLLMGMAWGDRMIITAVVEKPMAVQLQNYNTKNRTGVIHGIKIF